MKGYGLPRVLDIEFPDKLDITNYGLNTRVHGEKRKSEGKRRRRRIWKKRERSAQKVELHKQLRLKK